MANGGAMSYQGIRLASSIAIQKLYSLHYFEYRSDFTFPGESHDFWEFVCVDKGEILVTAGSRKISLSAGEVVFHQPDEFHDLRSNGVVAPNVLVVSFSSGSRDMDFFREKVLHIDAAERSILAAVIQEGRACFGQRLDNPWQTRLTPQKTREWGCEQMIRIKVEEFLLHIRRRYDRVVVPPEPDTLRTIRQNSDRELLRQVTDYMKAGIGRHLTLDEISRDNFVSRARLQRLFCVYEKCGVIEYFNRMKIETAKEMIRTDTMNFTQIADFLGYCSVHYFSRQFREQTGMSPSEYASSIKAAAEEPEDMEEKQI